MFLGMLACNFVHILRFYHKFFDHLSKLFNIILLINHAHRFDRDCFSFIETTFLLLLCFDLIGIFCYFLWCFLGLFLKLSNHVLQVSTFPYQKRIFMILLNFLQKIRGRLSVMPISFFRFLVRIIFYLFIHML